LKDELDLLLLPPLCPFIEQFWLHEANSQKYGLEGLRTVLQHVTKAFQIDTFDQNSILLAMLDTCKKHVGLIEQ
jgi:hypothetical protein